MEWSTIIAIVALVVSLFKDFIYRVTLEEFAHKIQAKRSRKSLINKLMDFLPPLEEELKAKDLAEIDRLVIELQPLYIELYAKKDQFTEPENYYTYQSTHDQTNLYLLKIHLQWTKIFLEKLEQASKAFLTASDNEKNKRGKYKKTPTIDEVYETHHEAYETLFQTYDTEQNSSLSWLFLHQKKYIGSVLEECKELSTKFHHQKTRIHRWSLHRNPIEIWVLFMSKLHPDLKKAYNSIKDISETLHKTQHLLTNLYEKRRDKDQHQGPHDSIPVDDAISFILETYTRSLEYGPYSYLHKLVTQTEQTNTQQPKN